MIHIIDPLLFVEKRVYCTLEEMQYVASQTTYLLNGYDITMYLRQNMQDYCRYSFVSNQAQSLLEDTSTLVLQSNHNSRYKTKLIVEEQVVDELADSIITLSDNEIAIYKAILNDSIAVESFVVLKAMEEILSYKQLHSLHTLCKDKKTLLICAYHPSYYDVLKDKKSNVLIVDTRLLVDSFSSMHQLLDYVKQELCDLSAITIVPQTSNELRVFYKGKQFYASYSSIKENQSWDMEALLASVCQCYEQEGNMHTLLTLCLSAMVSSSLSGGLYQGSLETLQQIRDNLEIDELGEYHER